MPRVDSILKTKLFSESNFKNIFISYLNTGLKVDFGIEDGLNNMPYSAIFNNENVLKKEISERIRNASLYINFVHNTKDKTLQNLIFLFIIFCSNEYNSHNEWQSFLNEPYDFKRTTILNGIKKIWLNYQEQIISKNLINDFDEVDPLPF